ncbi:MAG: hypothetical protein Q8R69_24915 [Telluria sp.]|nr:hypothetical protein [Telluria sp.]
MTPQDFIARWGPGGPSYDLNERQGAQPYFIDLCAVLNVPTPGSQADYVFEQGTLLLGEARGYADVFMRGHFAWENKAPGKNLDAALKQLQHYALNLSNPPLLVVCDRLTIRIHTQFNGHPSVTYTVRLDELDQPEKQTLLRRLWTDPEQFRPKTTSRDITEAAARSFATLADRLRKRGHAPEKASHFLTQCLFCFFAEDVDLLPGRMFERLVNNRGLTSDRIAAGLVALFKVMQTGGLYGPDEIPRFNGGLFMKIDVPELDVLDISELRNAAALNWRAVDVSIIGTLFERGFDPSKRSQLGMHYTDPATIMRIVEPVVQRPLIDMWGKTTRELTALMDKSKKKNDKFYKAARVKFIQWLENLRAFRVLDPACGSGNFLFLALKALKDIEHKSHLHAASLGLDREQDLVTSPDNVLGIELNEFAAELARLSIWIGELQWRREHGYEFNRDPVLGPLDHIENRDALLTSVSGGQYVEAPWPKASVIIGNPPFLGNKRMRSELSDDYCDKLRKVFKQRVPGGADLVCYWFEKAREAIATGGLGAAGLVATNSIRSGPNRVVLDRVGQTARIFEAWSDEPWVNEGAAVRVSLICFGTSEQGPLLNGEASSEINSNITGDVDLTKAVLLKCNVDTAFQGSSKVGSFEIPHELAAKWLRLPNPHQRSNADVVRPWVNGNDLARRPSNTWIIDFGTSLPEADARMYEAPYQYIEANVKEERQKNNREAYGRYWWRHAEARVGLRKAISDLPRYIVTPRVAKYRSFVWIEAPTLPDTAVVCIARADDVTMGILQSRFHVLWSLRQGSSLEDRPRYTPTSCFQTFPFPEHLTPADTADRLVEELPDGSAIPRSAGSSVARAAAIEIARAAKNLVDLREAWLNPPEWTERLQETVPIGMSKSPFPDRLAAKHGYEQQIAGRTVTKLYNLRPAWLVAAHEELDQAVALAYQWFDYTPAMSDKVILERLLTLNSSRCT